MITQFSPWGVWQVEGSWSAELAIELEKLGFGALWIGGSSDSELGMAETLLRATETTKVVTGVLNVWSSVADDVAQSFHRLEDRFPGRFFLGIGSGHQESNQDRYNKPYTAVSRYLDRLDKQAVPSDRRLLAALGDRMLLLSAERSLGAHPYLVTPAHTEHARTVIGSDALLAPEQKVVLGTDRRLSRSVARPVVENPYLHRINYVKNLITLGYSNEDVLNGGSDRLIDDLVMQGNASTVAQLLAEHHRNGADHVAVQLLSKTGQSQVDDYRELAAALNLNRSKREPTSTL